jgi:hypothetical protein
VRRIREAHSEWRAHNPCEYPPLCGERGWDAPRTGEAFKALWLKLEEGAVRSWRRMGKDGPYEAINPAEWRRGREYAMLQIRPPMFGFPGTTIDGQAAPVLPQLAASTNRY